MMYDAKKLFENYKKKHIDNSKGSHHYKKILFYEKVLQTGGGGHLVFIPLFFFKDCGISALRRSQVG